jgi:PPOX class probable F420-dependent enzyme
MPAPTVPESHRDLLHSRFGTLATVGPDGRPQVSEVWFLAEDDAVRVSLNVTRQKTKNLVANPAISVLLLDLANPLRYLELRGDAEITPDDDYSFADRLAAKYGEGVDLRQMDAPGQTRVVVTVKPVRVVAVDMSA